MELENKPPNTPLRQQKLKGWSFKYSSRSRGILYLVVGVLFILMGSLIISASNSVIEHKKRYDNVKGCEANKGESCQIEFDISSHMDSKVLLYYGISNMYQNHRKYTNSFSVDQLLGDNLSKDEIKTSCYPVTEIKDLHNYHSEAYPYNLTGSDIANPCGLIAKSYFNDEFILIGENNKRVNISEGNIAFYTDRHEKFKNKTSTEKKRWTDVTNGMSYLEHFIV